ncbi:UNVERIFIED_CONTAM: hypothetical protein GTU68_014404, partial [Idotea baltica]|nr:hypothetical protein [Idotea baltica]
IQTAFSEDLQDGVDLTTEALVPVDAVGKVNIVSRQTGVLAGNAVAEAVFSFLDPAVRFHQVVEDGAALSPGTVVAEIEGSMRSILTAERTALNFLTMLSGNASLTRKYVDAVSESSALILDTRKTIPGLRALQKYAVRCGGGTNHRIGLYDAILIKDNHLAWWKSESQGTLADAVIDARGTVKAGVIVEIEVDSLEQLEETLPGNPDIVLLDNMSNQQLSTAVELRNRLAKNVQLEASGGVTLDRVASIAATGVDRISVGALTHSAIALDLGFDWSQTAIVR